ncbi:MAG TPA: hypothetical protein VNO35_11235 [Steroidobacteraceae bacterium]|nr:hypothetical protein [Steroidobacteraceae bacterium]
MARITIKDLQRSDDLDREAMRSIVGGSRKGSRPVAMNPALANTGRVVDYPAGFGLGPNGLPTKSKRTAE